MHGGSLLSTWYVKLFYPTRRLIIKPPLHRVTDVVWSEIKQIGLIDSIFRNFYIPPIIFGNSSCSSIVFIAHVRAQRYPSHLTARNSVFVSMASSV